MPVKIEFSTANAEFAAGDGYDEVARILREIADRCEKAAPLSGVCRDLNGNTIGEWSATIDAEDEE